MFRECSPLHASLTMRASLLLMLFVMQFVATSGDAGSAASIAAAVDDDDAAESATTGLSCLQSKAVTVDRRTSLKQPDLLEPEDPFPYLDDPDMGSEDVLDEPNLCGKGEQKDHHFARLNQIKGGGADLMGEQSPETITIDLTHAFKHKDKVTIMVTAMSVAGAYLDGEGYFINRGEALEDTDNTLLELRLSADNQSVDVYKPSFNYITSDEESREAVKVGLGDGWLDSLPRIICPTPEQQHLIVIDADKLIRGGFYAAGLILTGATSYRINRAKSFPNNFDITAEFIEEEAPSLQVGFSVVQLPSTPMKPRAADDRLLFFTQDFTDLGYRHGGTFTSPSNAVDRQVSVIWRYNLDRLQDRTIRVHVDPTVPKRWRSWFREGIEGWNDGFELLGLPGTIKAVLPGDKDWPEDYDIADARFSTISWDLNSETLSIGLAKVDPRSGEIIKSDITMSDGWVRSWLEELDHLVPDLTHMSADHMQDSKHKEKFMSILQLGGKIQSGARSRSKSSTHHVHEVEESGRRSGAKSLGFMASVMGRPMTAKEQEDMLGAGLRSVVMHETGHILGLRHNFKGSLGVNISCLQDKACTSKHGIGSSVMDYVPINLPLDNKAEVHAFSPVIGKYDKLAIRYGYMDATEAAWPKVAPELLKVLEEAGDLEVCYDEDESGEDPTCAAYDLGEDPLGYFEHLLQQCATAQRNLLEMVVAPGEPFEPYGEAVAELLWKMRMVGHDVIRFLGGIQDKYQHRAVDGKKPSGASRKPIAASKQRRAIALLLKILQPEANGLVPPASSLPFLVRGSARLGQILSVDMPDLLRNMTGELMKQALRPERLLQIHRQEQLLTLDTGLQPMTLGEYLGDLVGGLLEPGLEALPRGNLSSQELDVQVQLIGALKGLFLYGHPTLAEQRSQTASSELLPAEISSHVLYNLRRARKAILAAQSKVEPEADIVGWKTCADKNKSCDCDGLVRYSRGASWSTARAVSPGILCSPEKFDFPLVDSLASEKENATARTSTSMESCECLAAHGTRDYLMRSHLSLLNREFTDVFCQAGVECQGPRVPLEETIKVERSGSIAATPLASISVLTSIVGSVTLLSGAVL
eukprot:TRINITY_DN3572_c0_g1_i1.p1 TRINITY_DN3572_c0_g1~~TRINITY_DN3572_c0_g1_i1.p1  ORF type:complete len:1095 (-),score=220.34 TRINITY_DN3572_c0_g1_i1:120-3404(-)